MSVLVHGTCVALGTKAALLRGPSGSGKSDLALRFLSLAPDGGQQAQLVADDQVIVDLRGADLIVSPPGTLAGKIEVRGLGIVDVPHLREATLMLAVDLVRLEDVPRVPEETLERIEIAGRPLPLLKLCAFEASAPLKLKLALIGVS